MGTTGVVYLIAALGAGLIGWRFLQSTLKVQKLGSPTTMGFLFSGIFLFLAVATGMIGLVQITPTRTFFAGAILFLAAACTFSLLLVRYVLSLKISSWQVISLSGSLGVIGTILATFANTPQTISVFLFLLHAIALVPLFFVFHYHFLLSRSQETKQKSLWFMILMPTWLSSISVPLVFASFLSVNLWTANVVMGTVGTVLLSFVITPLFAKIKGTVRKTEKATPKTDSLVLEFLNSF